MPLWHCRPGLNVMCVMCELHTAESICLCLFLSGKRSKKPMGSDAEDGDDSEQETEAAGGGGSSRRRAAAAEEEEEDSDREVCLRALWLSCAEPWCMLFVRSCTAAIAARES